MIILKKALSSALIYGQARTFSSSQSIMARHLEGKVAIVTASTAGIGLAIAQKLRSDGAQVVISSRKQSNVEEALGTFEQLEKNDDIHGVVCHVAKQEDRQNLIDETIKKFGSIDILVSNAGTNPVFGPMLDMIMPYSVSKTALLGLTKALSYELAGSENIRVNCIAPGIIDTKFAGAITSNDALAEKALENVHIKRFGQPEDIGGLASFLCSKDASYITGETIAVTGGLPSRL